MDPLKDALGVLGGLVLPTGDRWGDVAYPFQRETAREVLDMTRPPYHFETRARGASKTEDLSGIALAVMLTQAPAGARLYGLAADKEQGRLMLDSCDGFIRRTPEIRGAFSVESYKVTSPNAVLEILPADAASAWGLRPYFIVVDEIAQWENTSQPRRLWDAISSAAAKVSGCRMIVITTAGDPTHWSFKILEHARGVAA